MQWVAAGFLFQRGQTFVHKMDPRVRLQLAFSLFIISLLCHSIVELGLLIGVVIIIITAAKTLHRFAKSMIFTAGIALVAVILNFVFAPNSPHQAVVFGLRLFAVIASTSLFFLTTTPDELEHVMKWFKLPTDFVMVFVIAVRFVPVLILDALSIMDAQRSRGLEFDKGNILERIRKVIPVIVPLIAVALNRSLDLAEAMDSRGYGAIRRPTSLYHLKLKQSDIIATLILLLGAAVGLYVTLVIKLF